MNFLQVIVTFYKTLYIIHDIISIANPYPYSAKLVFIGVGNNKDQQFRL